MASSNTIREAGKPSEADLAKVERGKRNRMYEHDTPEYGAPGRNVQMYANRAVSIGKHNGDRETPKQGLMGDIERAGKYSQFHVGKAVEKMEKMKGIGGRRRSRKKRSLKRKTRRHRR